MRWLGEHEASLSEEANQYFNTVLNNLFTTAESNAKKMQESPEKRQALRLAASGLEKHIAADGLLKGLEREPVDQDDVLKDWSTILLKTQQATLDLLFDITSYSSGMNHSAVILGLLYACVDEFTAAHHLARHHYYAQAYNHLRTILETLDRIELFVKQPEAVAVWAGDDKKRIRNEFTPAKIRERLGKEKFDPIYGYLSENGTHPTFDMFRGRAVRNANPDSREARVFVAGTPFEHIRIFHFVISLLVGNMILSRMIELFQKYLNADECFHVMTDLTQGFTTFNEKHFVPWAAQQQIDASELTTLFESFLANEG